MKNPLFKITLSLNNYEKSLIVCESIIFFVGVTLLALLIIFLVTKRLYKQKRESELLFYVFNVSLISPVSDSSPLVP